MKNLFKPIGLGIIGLALILTGTPLAAQVHHSSLQSVTQVARSGPLCSDDFLLQFYGYAGEIAVGLGWDFAENHSIEVLLGVVEQTESHDRVWQATLKYEWQLFTPIPLSSKGSGGLAWLPLHMGFSSIYGDNDHLFVIQPDVYPDHYYGATAFRLTLNFGTGFRLGDVDIEVEYSALDIGLDAYVTSPEFMKEHYDYYGLEGVGSLGVIIKKQF